MKTFDISQWPRELERQIAALKPTVTAALAEAGEATVKIAKEKIGHYQGAVGAPGAVGVWPDWAELADSTKRDRVAKGFTENDPLLRTGELKESISFGVAGEVLVVGSKSKIAVYQELGTPTIPPRPFLAPSLFEAEPAVKAAVGGAVAEVLAGGDIPSGRLKGHSE